MSERASEVLGRIPMTYSRRGFVRMLAGGAALSLTALEEATAEVYSRLDGLNADYQGQDSPDGTYWEALRKQFMFQDGLIMMNNGTVGPMPRPVFNTLVRYFKIQATNPFEVYDHFGGYVNETRRRLAAFIGAGEDEVVMDRNTTEGMNFIAHGLDLKAGDEVLLSSLEHPGGTHPWNLKAKRYGIKLVTVPVGAPPASVREIVSAFEKAITPRSKVISISHTVYITGLIAPVKELAELAHAHGLLLLVDSAHGLGMLDLDMRSYGADYYCSSPYKWLGSPCGVGLLYMKRASQDQVWPTIASSGWDNAASGAHRFETLSQRADPIIIALGEALDFQSRVGKARIARRIRTLAGHLKDGLAAIPKVRLHINRDDYLSAGLTAFSIEGVDPQRVVDYVREKHNIVVRTIGSAAAGTRGTRVSTHYWLSTKEVDLFLEGVEELARGA
jgi:selenocysteine lyase/cysteine desulfurase